MTLASVSFALLAVAAVFQAVFSFRKQNRLDPVSPFLLGGACLTLLAEIVVRSVAISFPAITGTFESLVFFSGAVSAAGLAYRLRRKTKASPLASFGISVAALALLAIASSPIAPKEVLPPVPALRSFWLVLHISLAFIGEAFFTVAFVASLARLASRNEERRAEYERTAYTAIAIGYPVFTAGALIFGAVWAQAAWGSWWSWDPKETWSLVTWLAYALYLHLRIIRGRKDALVSVIAVLGYLLALFTFLGVNFLLPGLHRYGG